jgi:excisionase family DNA binding protein
MKPLEHFVDAVVAAQFLGCSRTHLLKLARDGRVPAHPLSDDGKKRRHTWRFRLSELEAFMLNGGSK